MQRTILHDWNISTQRHKLGSNLTPVTPESFAKWKRTRMDKKQAEEELNKKAKDAQAAAGKNTGMSGRDLVSLFVILLFVTNTNSCLMLHVSSRTTPSGLPTKTKRRKIGILRSTGRRRKTKSWRRRSDGLQSCSFQTVVVSEWKISIHFSLSLSLCLDMICTRLHTLTLYNGCILLCTFMHFRQCSVRNRELNSK